MKNNRIRLTESQLHQVIEESVKKILKEGDVINNRPINDVGYGKEYSLHDDNAWEKHYDRAQAKNTIDDPLDNSHWGSIVNGNRRRRELIKLKLIKQGFSEDAAEYAVEDACSTFRDEPANSKVFVSLARNYERNNSYDSTEPPTQQAILRSRGFWGDEY